MNFVIEDGIPKPPTGRKAGSKNKFTGKRDDAVDEARKLHEAGLSKIEASRKVVSLLNLSIQPDTISRLI